MSVLVKPLQADVTQFMDFWSAPADKITVDTSAANITFPNIEIAGLPSGLTIRRVALIMTCRGLKDTSGSANYINAASKTLRVMKSGGGWLNDSIVGITFDNLSLYCAADAKEAGPVIIGDADIKGKVDGNDTYNVMSENDNHTEGIVSKGNDLELYDVQVGLRVFYS